MFDRVLRHPSRCRQPGSCASSRCDRPLTSSIRWQVAESVNGRAGPAWKATVAAVLPDGSNIDRRVDQPRSKPEHPVRQPWIQPLVALRSASGAVPRRAKPVDCLPYEGNSEIDAPSYLRGKFLESFGPERACSPLRGCRQ